MEKIKYKLFKHANTFPSLSSCLLRAFIHSPTIWGVRPVFECWNNHWIVEFNQWQDSTVTEPFGTWIVRVFTSAVNFRLIITNHSRLRINKCTRTRYILVHKFNSLMVLMTSKRDWDCSTSEFMTLGSEDSNRKSIFKQIMKGS